MRKYKLNTLLIVHWVDIKTDPVWRPDQTAGERPIDIDCHTGGFYTGHDSELIYLAHTYGIGERDKTTIPIGCITKIEIAQLPDKMRTWTPRKKKPLICPNCSTKLTT